SSILSFPHFVHPASSLPALLSFPTPTLFRSPATLVILSLMASFPLGLYSILFAPLVIVNYEANVYDNSGTIMGYFFKYFYIVFFGLTYHVHCTLLKMPFLVNKLFAILYTGLVVWEAFMIILYFDL